MQVDKSRSILYPHCPTIIMTHSALTYVLSVHNIRKICVHICAILDRGHFTFWVLVNQPQWRWKNGYYPIISSSKTGWPFTDCLVLQAGHRTLHSLGSCTAVAALAAVGVVARLGHLHNTRQLLPGSRTAVRREVAVAEVHPVQAAAAAPHPAAVAVAAAVEDHLELLHQD